MLAGCSGPGTFVKPSRGMCDKIAYYNQYIDGAQKALVILHFVPQVAAYTMQASASLIIASDALNDAEALCLSASEGASSSEQVRLALDAVFNAIQNFNTAFGKINAEVKAKQ
jgi:hypothetical protein